MNKNIIKKEKMLILGNNISWNAGCINVSIMNITNNKCRFSVVKQQMICECAENFCNNIISIRSNLVTSKIK